MNPTIHLPIDLSPFCCTNKLRYSLMTPWSDGDHTFATDGKLIIAVPRRPTVPARDDAPKNVWRHIFEGWESDGQFRPLPALPEPEITPCLHCTNCIAGDRTCPECNGSKQTRCCECDQWRDCPDCKATGILKNTNGDRCTKCDGQGNVVKEQIMAINTQRVNVLFLRLIRDLPDVQIANSKAHDGALSFKFTGGEGRIMPLRVP